MHPTVLTTEAGDRATTWRRIAAVTIVRPVEVTARLRALTDRHLLPTRRRLFRRGRVRDHVEAQPDKDLSYFGVINLGNDSARLMKS